MSDGKARDDELSSSEGVEFTEDHDNNRAYLLAVRVERDRQLEKWGPQTHTVGRWLMILMEEVGEACKAAFKSDWLGFKRELIHTAAVAIAIATGVPDSPEVREEDTDER